MGPGVETPAGLLAAAKGLRAASDEEASHIIDSIKAPSLGMRISIPISDDATQEAPAWAGARNAPSAASCGRRALSMLPLPC